MTNIQAALGVAQLEKIEATSKEKGLSENNIRLF